MRSRASHLSLDFALGAASLGRVHSGAPRRRDGVVAQIQQTIDELGLGAGDRLPGERELAKRFGVSRGSVREAIQFLAVIGLLEVRHGGGSFLRVMPAEMERLRGRWHEWVARNRERVLEALEVRMGAEAFAAELAARRAGPEDLERLVRALQTMKAAAAAEDLTAIIHSDVAFHDAVLRAAGNRALRDLLVALGEELIPERAAVAGLRGRMARSCSEHFAIYDAVRAGDGPRAAEAMRHHLESVQHDVLANLLSEGELPSRQAGALAAGEADSGGVQKAGRARSTDETSD